MALSASLSLSIRDVPTIMTATTHFTSPFPTSKFVANTFSTGTPLFLAISRPSSQRKSGRISPLVSIRCEQSTQGSKNLDVWLGRFAMVGFAVAITIEIATGKGLLENFGVTTPLPTVALAVTGVVGVLTAVFIFQSASKN